MPDLDRERLFNHALEADDVDYATELATPNGYRLSLDFETGELTRTPVVLSAEELAEINARHRQERVSRSLSRSTQLPAFMDCVDKRSIPFYE